VSPDASQAFHDLAHDLQLAGEFLSGDAATLAAAACSQAAKASERRDTELAKSQGQMQMLERLKAAFKASRYPEVVKIAGLLPALHLLSDAELRMIEMARRRCGAVAPGTAKDA
jgi:hypothetical protein